MIQHDMMMFDHGMPRADGTLSPEQRPEADVNIEFQENSKMAGGVAGARVGVPRRERALRDRLSGSRRQPHAEHRLGAVPGLHRGDQPARERARRAHRLRAGIRTGTSRPTCSRRSATRISGSASTRRRRRWPRSRSSPARRSRADVRIMLPPGYDPGGNSRPPACFENHD